MVFRMKNLEPKKPNRYIKMISRRDGVCCECEDEINEGDLIIWDAAEGKAYCEICGKDLE